MTIDFKGSIGDIIISRRIGNNPHYKIKNSILDSQVILGKQDVQSYIYDILKISKDMELEKLFSEILAIPQEFTTSHFMLPPRQRQEIFDSILGVDIYRDCFEKLRPVEGLCKKEIAECKLQIGKLEIHLEDYDKEVSRLKELKENWNRLYGKIKDSKIVLVEAEKKLKKFEEMEDYATEKGYLQDQINRLREKITELQGKIDGVGIDWEKKLDLTEVLKAMPDKEKAHHEVTEKYTMALSEIE
ncbi:unnamed protein product, partial [marine sediment metagenome]